MTALRVVARLMKWNTWCCLDALLSGSMGKNHARSRFNSGIKTVLFRGRNKSNFGSHINSIQRYTKVLAFILWIQTLQKVFCHGFPDAKSVHLYDSKSVIKTRIYWREAIFFYKQKLILYKGFVPNIDHYFFSGQLKRAQ